MYAALCLLESKAPQKYKAGFAASLNEIATFAQVSKRTVQDTLLTLENAGLVQVISGRRGEKGQPNLANLYRLSTVGNPAKNSRRTRGGYSSRCHSPMAAGAIAYGNSEASNSATQERDSSLPPFPLSVRDKGGKEVGRGKGTREKAEKNQTASAPSAPPLLASGGQSGAHGTGEREGSGPQTHPGQTHPSEATAPHLAKAPVPPDPNAYDHADGGVSFFAALRTFFKARDEWETAHKPKPPAKLPRLPAEAPLDGGQYHDSGQGETGLSTGLQTNGHPLQTQL